MIKIKTLLTMVCLATALSLAHAQQQPDPHFQLYILAGQSNMSGRGYITDEFKNEGDSRVFMLDKDNKWVLAKNPLHFDQPSIAGVGPGLAFGIAMAKAARDPKIRIGLIPCGWAERLLSIGCPAPMMRLQTLIHMTMQCCV